MIELFKSQKFLPFAPHVVLLSGLFLLLLIGIVFNSNLIGYFFGTTAAMATDSPCILAGLIIGFSFYRYKYFIICGFVIATLTSFYINTHVTEQRLMMGLEPPGLNIFILRIISILVLAHIFNILRVYFLKDFNVFNLQKTEEK